MEMTERHAFYLWIHIVKVELPKESAPRLSGNEVSINSLYERGSCGVSQNPNG